jgi:hypothetical protein
LAIDRSDFLILATTLAAGGAGGWFVRDREASLRPPPAPAPAPAPVPSAAAAPSGPIPVTITDPKASTAPVCDDSQGSPEQCPSIGPADEGICGNIIFKRCNEFKASFKPRVATNAVACLRALKGHERCDPIRINQCGHMALMNACQEPEPPLTGELLAGTGGTSGAATVTLTVDSNQKPPSPVAVACENIRKVCSKSPLDPALMDCQQTLAGMNEVGRANMVECVSKNCTARGLWACEGVPK